MSFGNLICARLFALTLLTLAACQYDPHARLYTTNEPKREDVVGTYVLDVYHLSSEAGSARPAVAVELHADGTFVATNVPPLEMSVVDKNFFPSLVSGTGKWEKGSTGDLDDGMRIWGVHLHSPDNRFQPANFTGDKPPYGLIFTLGDPDSGDAVILKRKQ